jgi:hypothetical protein
MSYGQASYPTVPAGIRALRQPTNANPPWPLVSNMAPLGVPTTAPGCVRAHVRSTLTEWRMTALIDTAELVASELATNAVAASTDDHGYPLYREGRMAVIFVRLLADRARLVLEVWDMAGARPIARHVEATAESGRGLELVEALTANWGWKTAPDWPGKCVWAELRVLNNPAGSQRHILELCLILRQPNAPPKARCARRQGRCV